MVSDTSGSDTIVQGQIALRYASKANVYTRCQTRSDLTPDCGLVMHQCATHSTVILGLVPRTQRSAREKRCDRGYTGQRGVKVDPMRICALDEVDLPSARVVLDGFLALDRFVHVCELLVPDEHVDAILARKADPLPADIERGA